MVVACDSSFRRKSRNTTSWYQCRKVQEMDSRANIGSLPSEEYLACGGNPHLLHREIFHTFFTLVFANPPQSNYFRTRITSEPWTLLLRTSRHSSGFGVKAILDLSSAGTVGQLQPHFLIYDSQTGYRRHKRSHTIKWKSYMYPILYIAPRNTVPVSQITAVQVWSLDRSS